MTLATSVPIPFDEQFLRFLAAEESSSERLRAFYAQTREELRAFLLDPPVALTASEQAFFNGIQREVNRLADRAQAESTTWLSQSVPSAFVEGALQHSPGIAFTVLHDDAVKALSGYTLGLITSMNDGMRRIIQQQIGVGLLEGLTRQQVSARILASGLSNIPHWRTIEERAAAIARTEMMRAYNAGNLAGILDSGAKAARWITGQDERVCPICGPRHDHKYRISGVDSDDPRVKALDDLPGGPPPAHVKCRCTIRAFYFDEDEAVEPTPVAGGIIDTTPTPPDFDPSTIPTVTPKAFADLAEARTYYTTSLRDLTKEAGTTVDALKDYTGGAFRPVNRRLRFGDDALRQDAIDELPGGGSLTDAAQEFVDAKYAEFAQTADRVESALDSVMEPLPDTVTVFRAVDLDTFSGALPDPREVGADFDASGLLGVFDERGFMSTATKTLNDYGFRQVQMTLTVPKGTRAAWLQPLSFYPAENELLLDKGLRYAITKVEWVKARNLNEVDHWAIEATVLP